MGMRQTASRARPLARRADRTLRPPTVFMRARKPCVRARRIFDGLKVRFIAGTSSEGIFAATRALREEVRAKGANGSYRTASEKPFIRAL